MAKYIINYHTVTGRDYRREIDASSLNDSKISVMVDELDWMDEEKGRYVRIKPEHIVAIEVFKAEDASEYDHENIVMF